MVIPRVLLAPLFKDGYYFSLFPVTQHFPDTPRMEEASMRGQQSDMGQQGMWQAKKHTQEGLKWHQTLSSLLKAAIEILGGPIREVSLEGYHCLNGKFSTGSSTARTSQHNWFLLIMKIKWAQVLLMWNQEETKSFFHTFPREFCFTLEFPVGNIIFFIYLCGRQRWPPQLRAGYLGLTYVKWQCVKALKNMLAEVLRGVLQDSNIDYKLVHLGAWVGKCMKNAWEVCVRNAVHWCFIFIILFFFLSSMKLS